MDNKIKRNLVYLADNLTNLERILAYLVQNDIISLNESEEISKPDTPFKQNVKLLNVMQRKDFTLSILLEILRNTQNGNCADKIEGISPEAKRRKLEKPKILKSLWWPDKKLLIESLHKRKIEDKLLIEILHDRISTDKRRMLVICESADASKLTGMGGVGKTLTATWYGHHYEKDYDHVIWIDCGEDSLLKSFKKLVLDLKIEERNEIVDLEDFTRKSYEALEEFKCLWIFDNAESYRGDEGIKDVLPKYKDNFYCIITSRWREWGIEKIGYGQISRLELNIFEESESLEFFKQNLKQEIKYTEYQLKELCRLLGNLPLAMQLAVAAINNGNIDLKNYIEKTSTKDLETIVDTRFDDYEKTINECVNITLECIGKEECGAFAIDVFNVFGYIQPNSVEEAFLTSVFKCDFCDSDLGFCPLPLDFHVSEMPRAIELLTKYLVITKVNIDKKLEIDESKWPYYHFESEDEESESEDEESESEDEESESEDEESKGEDEKSKSKEGSKSDDDKLVTVLSIHRLLQQVIRHNGRENEKKTLRKIIDCEGFVDYKLLPFTKYADQQLRNEYPIVRAELLDQRQLERLVKEKRFEESVQLAEFINKELQTDSTAFNYAICLEMNGQMEENIKIVEELYKHAIEEKWEVSYENVQMGLLKLNAEVTKLLVGGHLLVSYCKVNSRERIQQLMEERKKFQVILSHEMLVSVLRILNSNLLHSNYHITKTLSTLEIILGWDTKRIALLNYAIDLSIVFPDNLQELVLLEVKFKDANAKDTTMIDLSDWLPKKLNALEIYNCRPKEIILSLSILSSIGNIGLMECSLNLDSVNRISPTELKLMNVSFIKDGQELSNVNANEIIDFHKMKRLELLFWPTHIKNVSIDLSEESANIEYLHLRNVDVVRLKSANDTGRVRIKEAKIGDCSLDLSILPSSLEKLLVLKLSKLFVSGGIDLPNVKYLSLDFDYLSHFHSLQITHLYLDRVKEVNLDLLPISVKLIRIDFNIMKVKQLLGGVINLDKLILYGFELDEINLMLPHFHPKQLVLSYLLCSQLDLIQLMDKKIPTIAIGRIDWCHEDFKNSIISKQLDRESKYYLLQEGTGKAIEKKDFDELCIL